MRRIATSENFYRVSAPGAMLASRGVSRGE
jgi:hypothetical protein